MIKVNTGICIGYNRTKKIYFVGVKESAKMELRIVGTFNTYESACKYIETLKSQMKGVEQNETASKAI